MSGSPMFDLSAGYYAYEEVNETLVRLLARHAAEWGAAKVLDVGCGRARNALAFREAGHSVTGIEVSPEANAIARERLHRLIDADLTDLDPVGAALGGERFDVVVFADVLEHLPDPLPVLTAYRSFLADGGRLVVSVPNVAVWDMRLRLLVGRWNYGGAGVLDRTHMRFFTFRTARLLVEEAGYSVERTDFEPGIVRAFLPLIKGMLGGEGKAGKGTEGQSPGSGAILDSPAYGAYRRFILPVERAVSVLLKGLFAFRIVLVARPEDGS